MKAQLLIHLLLFGTLGTGQWLRGGGLQNSRGGASEVLPLQKGGGRKSFSRAEGAAQQVLR